jgi:hypothetical protein
MNDEVRGYRVLKALFDGMNTSSGDGIDILLQAVMNLGNEPQQ